MEIRNMKKYIIIGLVALLLAPGTSLMAENKKSDRHGLASHSRSSAELRTAMRKLWEDHITYTRNYIISAVADLPDTDAVAKRLLRNQDDIGDAIKPFYGDDAGKKLSELLRDHILIATEVVKAAKANDKQNLEQSQKKWSANGKDIAAFLSGANPNWSKSQLEDMLQKHLDLTTGEVVGRLKKDWEADIRSYDKGHEHMLMFADALTEGIVKQFPEKFKNTGLAQNRSQF
jgi:hypothetical protein